MKFTKSVFILTFMVALTGDVFYFASLFFKSFAIDLITIFSNEIEPSQLNASGESILLFFTGLLGAMLYLIAFLLIALTRDKRSDQIKYVYYGLITWFLTDSIASLVYGFVWNIAFNAVFLITGVILLRLVDDVE